MFVFMNTNNGTQEDSKLLNASPSIKFKKMLPFLAVQYVQINQIAMMMNEMNYTAELKTSYEYILLAP